MIPPPTESALSITKSGTADAGPETNGSPEALPFDVCGPLPTGTTVLEASAGTGKTHAIGALVTRFVAEGVLELDRVLAVTFGRAASQELRERVRARLVDAERALADPAAARSGDDPVHALLAAGTVQDIAERRARLRAALAGYDAATIVTIHQFCHHVLAGLGIAGDGDADVTLVEDLDDLVVEVVDDLYLRGFARADAPPFFTRGEALALARAVVNDPQAALVPEVTPDLPEAAQRRVRFGERVRSELDARKRLRRVLGYDDLLARLATALRRPGGAAAARLRDRWSLVLVDEFQDTDPVQWEIIERAFVGPATVVLVGDPKQSIYAFRGGDVSTYLTASTTAGTRSTLHRNWRSDGPVVAAVQALLGGLALGDPQIRVRPVVAAASGSRLTGAPSGAPLRIRQVTRSALKTQRQKPIPIDRARDLVARDLAAEIAGLLSAGATFDGTPLHAGQVAVIVGTHGQARLVRGRLADLGIPSVEAGNQDVFVTPAGADWLVLLEAMEQPHRAARVRAAALTPFLGRTAEELDAGGADLTDQLTGLLADWADIVQARGVAAALELASAEHGMPARLLARTGGERRLTDLRHVGQELHAVARSDGLGVAALTSWLRRRHTGADDADRAERVRRLDIDAAAVQVVTLHASKGLQYPVVFVPFAFDRWIAEESVPLLHEDGRRVLDVGGNHTPGRADRQRAAARERAGEALRLLYVGLTRAQSQVVTWWAPTRNTPGSGLHRVLFGRRDAAGRVPDVVDLVSDDEATARLEELERAGGPVREVAAIAVAGPPVARPADAALFAVGRLDRSLDPAWSRLSYTSLSAAGSQPHGAATGAGASPAAGVASEPERAERDDEIIVPTDSLAVERAPGWSVPSPMAAMPTGTTFGTVVHGVLEHTDPQTADLLGELSRASAAELARRPLPVTADDLAVALLPALRTPLGPLGGQRPLTAIGTRDRLTELEFELPLGGGDRTRGGPTLDALAPLLRAHLPSGDPFFGYADRLAAPELGGQPLRGYLTGSLDAVLRLPGPSYVVADYKTNWLGDADPDTLSAWDYRPDALNVAMAGSDYPLQALLYLVALHRFLRWRQPGYRPEIHLGGALYLFVRGMCGPDTPVDGDRPAGVFGWRPPAGLVVALSDLLDAGGPDGDGER